MDFGWLPAQDKIAALFMKVGKSFPPDDELSRKVQDLEQLIENA